MKKNLLLIYFFACIYSISFAQIVPNGGLELWTAGEPDSWSSNNTLGLGIFVTQVSPGHLSNSAAQGEVVNTAIAGLLPPTLSSIFPLASAYTNLSCYYKFNSVSGDKFNVVVAMYDAGGNAIGAGSGEATASATGFTLLNVPIVYATTNVAQCYIFFTISDATGSGNEHLGSYFIVDDVGLNNSVGVNETDGWQQQNVSVQPNPASSKVTVSYSVVQKGDATLTIFDIAGKQVKSIEMNNEIPGNHNVLLEVGSLKEGFYFFRLATADASIVKRLEVIR
jgi:Secretion system C-terminal sorting domain